MKSLLSFPSGKFNQANGIGSAGGLIQNPEALKKMFARVGLPVATEEQQRAKWRTELEKREADLRKAGILLENGVWHFGEAKGVKSWPNIGEKSLASFPSGAFARNCGIGTAKGKIRSAEALREMFSALGLAVASREQQEARWKSQLEGGEADLRKAGILLENGVWHFGEAKGMNSWPNIGNRNLRSFPNADFNKTHGIGNAKGTVQRVGELKKLFASLGLAVAGPF